MEKDDHLTNGCTGSAGKGARLPVTLVLSEIAITAILPANGSAQKVAIFKPFLLKSGRILRFLNWHVIASFFPNACTLISRKKAESK